jgi:amino acid permease
LIGAIAAQWSLKNILSCAQQAGAYSYTSLVRKIAGRKADRLMMTLILISISGSCISEQIVITKLVQTLLINMGMEADVINRVDVKFLIMFMISMFVIFPLALTRKMSGFRYMSVITMASLAYILVALLIELPYYFE